MNFVKKHLLFFIFFSGLIVRLLIMFADYSWDVNNHMVWAKDFLTRGPQNFYETQSSNVFASLTPNYPPLAVYIFAAMRLLSPLIHSFYWWLNIHIPLVPSGLIFFLEKTVFLAGLMKIPSILTDLGTAYFIYLFAKKIIPVNKKSQIIAVCLVLFNPAFIFNSSLWGQIDSIPIFLVLAAVYFLLYARRSTVVSAVFFTLALLVKPTALIFLPVYLVLFIKKSGIKKTIFALFLNIIIFYLFFLSFMIGRNNYLYPFTIYLDKIIAAQSLPFATNGAFNFWVLVTGMKGIKDTAPFILGISYRLFGYIIVGFIDVFVILHLIKNKKSGDFFMALFISAFAAFLFLTKMHERYSLLPPVFLLLFSLKKFKYIKWYVILSAVSLVNHYHSWAVPRIELLVNIINSPIFINVISLTNIIIFFYLLRPFFASSFSSSDHEQQRKHI